MYYNRVDYPPMPQEAIVRQTMGEFPDYRSAILEIMRLRNQLVDLNWRLPVPAIARGDM